MIDKAFSFGWDTVDFCAKILLAVIIIYGVVRAADAIKCAIKAFDWGEK
jgi:hypothetical protein